MTKKNERLKISIIELANKANISNVELVREIMKKQFHIDRKFEKGIEYLFLNEFEILFYIDSIREKIKMNDDNEQLLKDLTDIEIKLKKFDLTIKVLSVNPKIIKFGYTLEFNGDFWGKNEKLNLDSYNPNTIKSKILKIIRNIILKDINNLETLYRIELQDKLEKLNEDVGVLIYELDNID